MDFTGERLLPRPGAPVAMPLFWEELDTLDSSDQFHIKDVRKRIKQAHKHPQKHQDCRQGVTKKIVGKFI